MVSLPVGEILRRRVLLYYSHVLKLKQKQNSEWVSGSQTDMVKWYSITSAPSSIQCYRKSKDHSINKIL